MQQEPTDDGEELERETSLGKREDDPGNVRHLNLGKPSSWAAILNSSLSSHHKEKDSKAFTKNASNALFLREHWPRITEKH